MSWFFLAYILGSAVTQAGPFTTKEHCEAASAMWKAKSHFHQATPCYQGGWKER